MMERRERYRIRHEGQDVEVRWVDPGFRSVADWEVGLYVDGVPAATARLALGSRARLRHGGLCVEIRRAPTGRLQGCALLDPPPDQDRDGKNRTEQDGRPGPGAPGRPEPVPGRFRPVPIPLRPTPGSRAERRYLWQRRHPRCHASRHVVRELATAVIGALGLGALVAGLLPRLRLDLPLPDLDLPRIDLPDLPLPEIPRPDLPDLPSPPHWLLVVLGTAKWWIPVLIAVGAAVREVRVVRKRQDARQDAGRPVPGPGGGECAPSTPNVTPRGDGGSSTRPRPASPRRATSEPPPPTSAPGPE